MLRIAEQALSQSGDVFGPAGSDAPVGTTLEARSSGVLLVLGDNAAGKSLVRRLLTRACRQQVPQVEPIHLSMAGRTAGEERIGRVVVYGCEEDTSTGHNSVRTIEGALRTSRAKQVPHALLLDEPDLGLSDRWASAMGREVCAFMRDPPALLVGLMLTTHRAAIVRELLGLDPSSLLVGHQWPLSLEQWLGGDPRPVMPIGELRQEGMLRHRMVAQALRRRELARS